MMATSKPQTDKRQAILDSALSLFVEQGFHASSTASIARNAGVATGTLFHHFPSKDALLECLFLEIKQEFADAILAGYRSGTGPSGIPQTEESQGMSLQRAANLLWQSAIDWGLQHPQKQAFFQQYAMSPAIAAPVRAQAMNLILGFIGQLIGQGQRQGLIADYPLALMLENCQGQYLAASRFFLDNPQLGKDESHRQASFALFWRAMAL
ncbi:TetR/AcrR family transcriptional regulator [Shewanella salipaludis]|uniref:TetR/AcrR family transcriptional regulator n=1 Tax=Shewanella salipaludis TaxID=2723052 RepID=A0A972FSH5_9GAMM|nr:TetR/AcrR family transcriptional regulator [Shewanella salipaludis]NMH64901.1 TetR/AcrR family transcriptional regulator [Shewanella salipaludis]